MTDKMVCKKSRIGEAWLIKCGKGEEKTEIICIRKDKQVSGGLSVLGIGGQVGTEINTCDCFFTDEIDNAAKKKIAKRFKLKIEDIEIMDEE